MLEIVAGLADPDLVRLSPRFYALGEPARADALKAGDGYRTASDEAYRAWLLEIHES